MYSVQLQQARILMLDDEVANTCMMTNILHRLGYANLESLSDPYLLLEKIASFQPDLLLLDLSMPGLNGFEVLELLRQKLPAAEWIPVLVISASATPTNKRRALAAGAAEFLTKPFDPSEMNMRIRGILEARLLRREIEDQNRELEERVQERTAQLQHALDDIRAAQQQMLQQERLTAFAEMAGGVVHDFSNTLMAVIGYSEMLLSSDGALLANTAKALDYLRIINVAGRDGAEVVSRLRDFSRSPDQANTFLPCDLTAIAEQAVMLARPKWKNPSRPSKVRISMETDFVKSAPVNGNAAELRAMLTSLVFNAVDAMPGGGTITLRTRLEGEAALVEVTDTGSGMPPEVRDRCFDPFFSTKGDAGNGLGLAMVFGIVKRHQGSVEIETEVGRGTTFKVLLPCLLAAPALELAGSLN